MSVAPDAQRQASLKVDYIDVRTTTLIVASIGESATVMTPDEVEKASIDLWSAAGHARRATAINERKAALARRPVKPRRARKGKIPLTS